MAIFAPKQNGMTMGMQAVFLIDDDRSINFYNKWILEGLKIARSIQEFPDAESALEALEQAEAGTAPFPELVLVDVNMPGMDGLDFASKFRELDPEGKRSLLVFLLTSPLLPEQESQARSMGFEHFLNKPLEESDIKGLLANVPNS